MKRLVTTLAMLVGFSGVANAGILLEPYVGYESGSLIFIDATDVQSKFTNTALDAGLRLGFRSGGFWLAAEGMASTGGKSKPEVGPDMAFSGTTLFASMGYDFSTRVRLMAGYGFQDSLTVKDDTGPDTTYFGGMAAKVGLGFYILPHAALNVEYVMRDYKKVKVNDTEQTITDAGGKSMKSSAVLVTLSFPVTF